MEGLGNPRNPADGEACCTLRSEDEGELKCPGSVYGSFKGLRLGAQGLRRFRV